MKKGFISDVFTALVFMLAAICLSVMVTLNFLPLYYHDVKALNIAESSGISEESIKENYKILIDYNNFWGPDTLEFNGLSQSYEGRTHFMEVKRIFVAFEYTAIASTLLFILLAVIKRKSRRHLLLGGVFTIVIPALVGVFVALNWEWTFITFHKLMFNNDYWIFYPDKDPVITILPDEFFMHAAVMIVALALIMSLISIFIYIKRKKYVS